MPRRYPWAKWPDEKLLQLKFRDLKLQMEGTWLAECVDDLHRELEVRDIRLKPHIWISDEWFSPDGVSGFAVPFYLVHPRLMKLERAQFIEIGRAGEGHFDRP